MTRCKTVRLLVCWGWETQACLKRYYLYDSRWIEWERNLCQPLSATYQLWRGLQQRSAWPERGPVVWLWCRAVLSRTQRKREECGLMRCTASGTRGCWPGGWPAEWSASAAAQGGPTPASTAAPGGHKYVNTSDEKIFSDIYENMNIIISLPQQCVIIVSCDDIKVA